MTHKADHDKSLAPKCPECGHRFYGKSREQVESDGRWPCPECGNVYDGSSFAQRIAAADKKIDEAFRTVERNSSR